MLEKALRECQVEAEVKEKRGYGGRKEIENYNVTGR
jgi:hypothetical protein